jgi:hypothetical protein
LKRIADATRRKLRIAPTRIVGEIGLGGPLNPVSATSGPTLAY